MPIQYQNPSSQDFGTPQGGFNLIGHLFDRYEQNRNNKIFKDALSESDILSSALNRDKNRDSADPSKQMGMAAAGLTPESLGQVLLQSILKGASPDRLAPLAAVLGSQAEYGATERKNRRFLDELNENGPLGAVAYAPKEAISPLVQGYNENQKQAQMGPELSKGQEVFEKKEGEFAQDYLANLNQRAQIAEETLKDQQFIRPYISKGKPFFDSGNKYKGQINSYGNRQFDRMQRLRGSNFTTDESDFLRKSSIISRDLKDDQNRNLLDQEEIQARQAIKENQDAQTVMGILNKLYNGKPQITTFFPQLVKDYADAVTYIKQKANTVDAVPEPEQAEIFNDMLQNYVSQSSQSIRGPQITPSDSTSPASLPKQINTNPDLSQQELQDLIGAQTEKKKDDQVDVLPDQVTPLPDQVAALQESQDQQLPRQKKSSFYDQRDLANDERLESLRADPFSKQRDQSYEPKGNYQNSIAGVLGKEPSFLEKVLHYGPRNVAIPYATRNADLLSLGLNTPSAIATLISGKGELDRVTEQVAAKQTTRDKINQAVQENPVLAAFDDLDTGDDLLPGYQTLPSIPSLSQSSKGVYDTLTGDRGKPITETEKKLEQLGIFLSPNSRQGKDFFNLIKEKGLFAALKSLDPKSIAKQTGINAAGGGFSIGADEVLSDNPFIKIPGQIAANLLGQRVASKVLNPGQTAKQVQSIMQNLGSKSKALAARLFSQSKNADPKLLKIANDYKVELPLGVSTGSKFIQDKENRLRHLTGAAGQYQQVQKRLEGQMENAYHKVLGKVTKGPILGVTQATDNAKKEMLTYLDRAKANVTALYKKSDAALGTGALSLVEPKNAIAFVKKYTKELESPIGSTSKKQLFSAFHAFTRGAKDEGFKKGNVPKLTIRQMLNTMVDLNDINYELTGNVKNLISPFRREIEKDLMEYANKNNMRGFVKNFDAAKKAYAEYAKTYIDNDAVSTVLKTSKPETIINLMKTPSQAEGIKKGLTQHMNGKDVVSRDYSALAKDTVDYIIGSRTNKDDRFSIDSLATQSLNYKNRDTFRFLLGQQNYKELKDVGYMASKIKTGASFLANPSQTYNVALNNAQLFTIGASTTHFLTTGNTAPLMTAVASAFGPYAAAKITTSPSFKNDIQNLTRQYLEMAKNTDKSKLQPMLVSDYVELLSKSIQKLPKSVQQQLMTDEGQKITKATAANALRNN